MRREAGEAWRTLGEAFRQAGVIPCVMRSAVTEGAQGERRNERRPS